MTSEPAATLAAIRTTEREMARRRQAARDDAAAEIAAAREECERIIREARERGQNAARIRYEEVVRRAEAEASLLKEQADAGIAELQRRALPHLPALTHAIVDLVLAPPAERGK